MMMQGQPRYAAKAALLTERHLLTSNTETGRASLSRVRLVGLAVFAGITCETALLWLLFWAIGWL